MWNNTEDVRRCFCLLEHSRLQSPHSSARMNVVFHGIHCALLIHGKPLMVWIALTRGTRTCHQEMLPWKDVSMSDHAVWSWGEPGSVVWPPIEKNSYYETFLYHYYCTFKVQCPARQTPWQTLHSREVTCPFALHNDCFRPSTIIVITKITPCVKIKGISLSDAPRRPFLFCGLDSVSHSYLHILFGDKGRLREFKQ